MITAEEALHLAKKYVNDSIDAVKKFITTGFAPKDTAVWYGVCNTLAGVKIKEVTIPGITKYTTGLNVRIKFMNQQSYNGTGPELNINSLGAKPIRSRHMTTATQYDWGVGDVLDLVYDGSDFVIASHAHASTSYFGITKLSSSTSSTSEDMAATVKLANTKVPKAQLIDVVTPSFSTLPSTFYSNQLTADCKVIGNAVELSTPSAGDIDWDVSFAAGSLTISGTFHGSTATTAKMSIWIPGQEITLSSS